MRQRRWPSHGLAALLQQGIGWMCHTTSHVSLAACLEATDVRADSASYSTAGVGVV
jgi:hypothetical protein